MKTYYSQQFNEEILQIFIKFDWITSFGLESFHSHFRVFFWEVNFPFGCRIGLPITLVHRLIRQILVNAFRKISKSEQREFIRLNNLKATWNIYLICIFSFTVYLLIFTGHHSETFLKLPFWDFCHIETILEARIVHVECSPYFREFSSDLSNLQFWVIFLHLHSPPFSLSPIFCSNFVISSITL